MRFDSVYYEMVAASATAQALGATGVKGDYISRIIIIPGTTSPGAVSILDDDISMSIFPGGANSVNELRPMVVELGLTSKKGGWKITTGANVTVLACGQFT